MNNVFDMSELISQQATSQKPYMEFLRIPSLSTGIYVLKAGTRDMQTSHSEAEVYYVVQGRARFQLGTEDHDVRLGSIIFVKAGQDHRFHSISEDLVLLVFFAPAERATA
jgi:mannose-6-phosphate isomerase-like protein (cupin superfamily)